ncbi:pregnancy zone protein-like [Ailuropoda melanoleuca]|uniref:pregnancy zone protein-like n=1 Tax=Ailuropoda melanoleuca TaxID=9646 RepID=UPI0014945F82|nr:pregnancy zone protein-like [Ailuropoda melanoleuca]
MIKKCKGTAESNCLICGGLVVENVDTFLQFLIYFLHDRYTYGKPVPGLATVSMCRKLFHPTYCQKQEFCEKFSQQLNSNGCSTQEVKSNLLQIKNMGYEMQLKVEAKIREEGTDLVFTGNGTSEITNIVTRLKFVKVDSHFRRGIPFFGQVLLVDGKDVPIPNKLVFISANEANYLYNPTTNDQGLVQFSINTTNILANKISVMAYDKQPNLCFNSVWLREEHLTAQHIAKHAFALRGNYVHLEPVAGTLLCGQTQIIKAYYIFNGEAIGEPKELIFYYLIMAKGSIVRSGTHAVSVELGDDSGLGFLTSGKALSLQRLIRAHTALQP